MRLLILTQKVDKNDAVLGFFHNWLKALSFKFENIMVIALSVGDYDLPNNVKVFSLGKEKKQSRCQYIIRLYKYIWQERKNYDAVFVHMNVEYILVAAWLWKLLGKKITLWYNHKHGSFKLYLSNFFVNKIFHTSPFACPARFKKSITMPVGIDTDLFKRDSEDKIIKPTLLSIGRISPVKNIDILIEAMEVLDKQKFDFLLNIYGDAPDRDKKYLDKLKTTATNLVNKKKIIFHSPIANSETPAVYSRHNLFINLTDSGSFDKTILESMSCQNLVLICNQSLGDDLPEQFLFEENNIQDLVEKIKQILSLSDIEQKKYKEQFRQYVINNHSLNLLSDKIKINLENL